MMIIDSHVHFYDPSRPGGIPWPPPGDSVLYRRFLPDDFREVTSQAGVGQVVVIEAGRRAEDNEWTLNLAPADNLIAGFVGSVDPGRADFEKCIEDYRRNPVFKGIRLLEMHLERFDKPMLGRIGKLEESNLSMDVYSSDKYQDAILSIADAYPEMPVILNHLYSLSISGEKSLPAGMAPLRELAARDNVFCKVSDLQDATHCSGRPERSESYHPALAFLWEVFGETRLLYGSNWPVSERVGSYASQLVISEQFFLGKGKTAWERFTCTNAQVAYQLSGLASSQGKPSGQIGDPEQAIPERRRPSHEFPTRR